jgi:hypothetical protein
MELYKCLTSERFPITKYPNILFQDGDLLVYFYNYRYSFSDFEYTESRTYIARKCIDDFYEDLFYFEGFNLTLTLEEVKVYLAFM